MLKAVKQLWIKQYYTEEMSKPPAKKRTLITRYLQRDVKSRDAFDSYVNGERTVLADNAEEFKRKQLFQWWSK